MTLDPVSFIPALLFALLLSGAIVALMVYATLSAPEPDESSLCTSLISTRHELRNGARIQAQESEMFDWHQRV